jgi:hypothetical protein
MTALEHKFEEEKRIAIVRIMQLKCHSRQEKTLERLQNL